MDIHAACHAILGDRLANSIILDQGIHWAVIAAMAQATTDDESVDALDEFCSRLRRVPRLHRRRPCLQRQVKGSSDV